MTPYVGLIQSFAFGIIPRGWAQCAGQLLQINQNQALFSLLGTTFGGDGIHTFGLPDLRSRTPISSGNNQGQYILGQAGGEEHHTLAMNEVPQHNHNINGSTNNTNQQVTPLNNVLCKPASAPVYLKGGPSNATMSNATIAPAGGSAGHENRQPYLAINWCIALTGIYPSRS